MTLEPCSHHGSTPPCADAVVAAGVARVVVGPIDPNPEVAGAGVERCARGRRGRGARRARARGGRSRRTGPGAPLGRPFVTYKAAVTLDGRVTVPGSRWVTGEESRRLVHELRARSDAVAVGMGTFRADAPRLDARGVDAIASRGGSSSAAGPLPAGSELELVTGRSRRSCGGSPDEGVQSLLLEGGPTLATAFLRAGSRRQAARLRRAASPAPAPRSFGDLEEPLELYRLTGQPVGDDVLPDRLCP